MEIKEFLDLSAGKWFSQRTSYQLEYDKTENSKSEITLERLSGDHREVVNLCQQYRINPNLSLGGIKASWDNSVDWGKTKQTGSTIIVLMSDPDNSSSGRLLRSTRNPQNSSLAGRYVLGNDQALTLMVEEGATYSEERLWFASPNLRLRTSLIKSSNRHSAMAFYSEIRKILPPTEDK